MRGKNIAYFALGAALVASGLYGAAVGNLTNFTAGTPIRANEVNTNFGVLRSAIEALEAPVDTARLADRAVNPAKMADQGCPGGQALAGYSNGNTNCVAVQGGAGLTEVARDATLSGNGTAGSPLGLANNAVSTTKLANGAVTTAKLADEGITSAKIARQPLILESTGAPQLDLRETSAGQFSQLRLSVQGSPNFWDIAARDVLHIYREGTGNVVSLQTNGDMNLAGNLSQTRDKDGTTKASALVTCGATPVVQRFFNPLSGAISVTGNTAGVCTVEFGFDVSDRFWQVSPYSVVGSTVDPQIVNCQFGAAVGNSRLTCVVRSITTGNAQSGSFMVTVF
jgi:hypothetical protein